MFIINESTMNGTVTMSIKSIGIDCDTWNEAIKKVEAIPNLEITHCDEDSLTYVVPQPEDSLFEVWGRMKNEKLSIL